MNYYNEYDKYAATQLREFIKEGMIPNGHVDERSITEVKPEDLEGFTQCHFFAGIGGWPLALELAGVSPDTPLWTGSCPCQPFSVAGKNKAQGDKRHLWPVFYDLIRECKPNRVFGEQVEGAIRHGWLDGIQRDMEAEDYTFGACVLGAHSVNAPHIRQRLYFGAARMENASCERRGRRRDGDQTGESGSLQAARSGTACWVGNAESDDQRRYPLSGQDGERCKIGRPSSTCGMADSVPPGQSISTNAGTNKQSETTRRVFKSAGSRDACGLADSDDAGLFTGGKRSTSTGYGETTESDCRDCGLADSEHKGSQGRLSGRQDTQRGDQHGYTGRDSAVILCRDGKLRRVPAESVFQCVADGVSCLLGSDRPESGFPLAEKIEGQTHILKGFGNAIVPQVAAEFIRAFIESV